MVAGASRLPPASPRPRASGASATQTPASRCDAFRHGRSCSTHRGARATASGDADSDENDDEKDEKDEENSDEDTDDDEEEGEEEEGQEGRPFGQWPRRTADARGAAGGNPAPPRLAAWGHQKSSTGMRLG